MFEGELMCYCGQDKLFSDCCGAYISGKKKVQTALDLMRSRYAAYVIHDLEYIQKTMLQRLIEQDSHQTPQYIRLEIITAGFNQVEFKAYYIQNHRLGILHELSHFVFKDHQWFYSNGTLFPTALKNISLNAPCPCKSAKKG